MQRVRSWWMALPRCLPPFWVTLTVPHQGWMEILFSGGIQLLWGTQDLTEGVLWCCTEASRGPSHDKRGSKRTEILAVSLQCSHSPSPPSTSFGSVSFTFLHFTLSNCKFKTGVKLSSSTLFFEVEVVFVLVGIWEKWLCPKGKRRDLQSRAHP